MAAIVQNNPDIYHILNEKENDYYKKHIAYSNSDRVKNWVQERLTSPEGIAKNPLSHLIKMKCKDHSRVHNTISMCGFSAIIVLNTINASYLKIAVSITSIASIFLYNKLAKALESKKANCFETAAVKACLPYLTDTSAVEEDLNRYKYLFTSEESDLDEKEDYLPREKLLKEMENLKNLSFFTSNLEPIKKYIEIFLKNDQMNFNKIRAGRDFISHTFYSVNCLLILKETSAIKFISNMRKINTINIVFGVIIAGLIALSILSTIDSVKNALKLIGHRNDEAKKQELLASVTEEEKTALLNFSC